MTELYKPRYSQATPGINRTDDSIQFSHADKCISHFGDGLAHPEKLTADAAIARNQGRDTKVWCETLNKIGESGIRNAFRARENKLRQWREHLNKEVDKLAKELERVTECQTLLVKKRQYFANMLRASDVTSDFRKRLEDYNPNDRINICLKQEGDKILKADNDMKLNLDKLKECERDLQKARNSLMSEAEAKSLTINIGKRCQHAEPLLNFPYIPADHSVDQIYHPNSEEDWERNLADKIQKSVSTRHESTSSCERALASVMQNEGDTAEAWYRTSKALQESVQEDEKLVHNIKNLLKQINQDITSANQRIAYFFNDLKIQDRVKNTQLWRLQTMTYRPGPDHIRDFPIRKLDEEVSNIGKKSNYITDNLNHNKDLMQKLNEEKNRQTLELERVSRKLFTEKENCLGLRRTVKIEGVKLDDYVTHM